MLLRDSSNRKLQLKESIKTPSGDYTGVVLATLEGVAIDYSKPNENDRFYTHELWKKAFSSQDFKDNLRYKNILGEPDHPEERVQVNYKEVSHAIREIIDDPKNQCYRAVVDILDTPNGRILKTLVDYGTTLGLSTRGLGDSEVNSEGIEVIDPDTYQFITIDVVCNPSNKAARITPLTESTVISALRKNKKALKEVTKSLKESGYIHSPQSFMLYNKALDDAEVDNGIKSTADNKLKSKIKNNNLVDKFSKSLVPGYKNELDISDILDLVDEVELDARNKTNEIDSLQFTINGLYDRLEDCRDVINHLKNQLTNTDIEIALHKSNNVQLESEVKSLKSKLTEATETNDDLNDELLKLKSTLADTIDELKAKVNSLTKDNRLLKDKNNELDEKLKESDSLLKKSNKLAESFKTKYIESRLSNLGINPTKEVISNISKLTSSQSEVDDKINTMIYQTATLLQSPYSLDGLKSNINTQPMNEEVKGLDNLLNRVLN